MAHQPGPIAASGDSGRDWAPSTMTLASTTSAMPATCPRSSTWSRTTRPGERRDDGLEAEQDAEHPLREVAQGDELEGVGQHRRQDGDAETERDVPGRPAVDGRQPERRDRDRRHDEGEGEPVEPSERLAGALAEDDVGRPHDSRERREADTDEVEPVPRRVQHAGDEHDAEGRRGDGEDVPRPTAQRGGEARAGRGTRSSRRRRWAGGPARRRTRCSSPRAPARRARRCPSRTGCVRATRAARRHTG